MSEQLHVRIVEAELSVIRPGDVVLLRMPREATAEQLHHIAEQLRERMPDVTFCVLTGVDGIDVFRNSEPAVGGSA